MDLKTFEEKVRRARWLRDAELEKRTLHWRHQKWITLRQVCAWGIPNEPIGIHKTYPTGCPQVRDIFDTPLFSGQCWCMAKPFDVLNGESLRFFLMYKTLCFINLAPPKIMVQNIVNISYIHSSKPWSKPGLANVVADCSAPCGPIQSKFHVVNRLGYGNRWLEFRWCALTYAGAAVEKPSKTDDFCRF